MITASITVVDSFRVVLINNNRIVSESNRIESSHQKKRGQIKKLEGRLFLKIASRPSFLETLKLSFSTTPKMDCASRLEHIVNCGAHSFFLVKIIVVDNINEWGKRHCFGCEKN